MPNVEFHDFGLIDYKTCWDQQETWFAETTGRKMQNRREPENAIETVSRLIFCEHPHVYTLGKSGSFDNLLLDEEGLKTHGIEFYKINRGGDITYHGPGQLVGYPILDLDHFFTDIHKYLRFLEEAIIRTLAEWGIEAGRFPGYTGVWLEPDDPERARKICAMGVRCSRWVTMHGFAFNVNADLEKFGHIVPCGIKDKDVASMHTELGHEVDMAAVKDRVLHHLTELFEFELTPHEQHAS